MATTKHTIPPPPIIHHPRNQTTVQYEDSVEDILSLPILLSDQVNRAVKEAKFFRLECSEVNKRVDRLSQMLRSAVRLTTSTATFYDRPLRRISAEVYKNLEKSRLLVKKCRRRSIIRNLITRFSATDFRKILAQLDSSVADMKWVLSIYEAGGTGGGIVLTLPPIATNDPILSWVWSFVASLNMGRLDDQIDAAKELASLAEDNDRNKQIIVEEGVVLPLLKLLKDGSSMEGQIAAAHVLCTIANNPQRVQVIINELGLPVIVNVLGNPAMKVQIKVANLVAKMAENSPRAQEDFARENVIRPLVTLLSLDVFLDEAELKRRKQSIHSVVNEVEKNLYLSGNYKGMSKGSNHKKERENEKTEVKLELKLSCSEALWMLAKGSVSNSRKITETKGLLCLAKLVETENGQLQTNCLMAIMEITAAAESNADLRRAAFKTNSPAAKVVVDQLLRVIKDSENPRSQIAAVRAIGFLARTFPARETRIIEPLVKQLGHRNQDVAIEAVISLGKFASPENFLCVEHSKRIIEFSGVPLAMRLLKGNRRAFLYGLVLLCYLAINAGKSEALEQAGVVTVFERIDHAFLAQYPELKELITKAMYHLSMFRPSHSGVLVQP